MIYVSQGHEKSIALEVFIKSFLLLTQKQAEQITLVCFKESAESTLKTLHLQFSFTNESIFINSSELKCIFLSEKSTSPQSTSSLNYILKNIKNDDILVTLPTSKDQLILNNVKLHGHTEYFRAYFDQQEICMNFLSTQMNMLLLTDHIPLSEVSLKISSDYIKKKVHNSLEGLKRIGINIDEIIFSGINPHAGENGLMGDEERHIQEAVKSIPKSQGPYSGDVLHTYFKGVNQLIIYAFHDQGLIYFKSKYKLQGINATFGLPFLRLSVDHGTAFDLFGKNCANYQGCYYLFNWLFKNKVLN